MKIYGTIETTEVLPVSISYAAMNNKVAVVVAKYTDVFLLLTYGRLKCFLPSGYMQIDFNKFININMIYDNLGSAISVFPSYILSMIVTQRHTN